MSEVFVIILAAGGSTRMGAPKALAKWGEETLVSRAVAAVYDAGFEPVVVVGDLAPSEVEPHASGARIVVNSRWNEGMSTSIAAGVATLPEHATIGILAVDQPLVGSDDLAALERALRDRDAAAASHDGKPGIPAFFSPKLRDELCMLEGDRGARAILRSGSYTVALLPSVDPSDADTPAALERLDREHR